MALVKDIELEDEIISVVASDEYKAPIVLHNPGLY